MTDDKFNEIWKRVVKSPTFLPGVKHAVSYKGAKGVIVSGTGLSPLLHLDKWKLTLTPVSNNCKAELRPPLNMSAFNIADGVAFLAGVVDVEGGGFSRTDWVALNIPSARFAFNITKGAGVKLTADEVKELFEYLGDKPSPRIYAETALSEMSVTERRIDSYVKALGNTVTRAA